MYKYYKNVRGYKKNIFSYFKIFNMWLCTYYLCIQVYTPQNNKVKCVHNIQMPQLVINCNNIKQTNQTFFSTRQK